jgi:acyl-coenzyme A thioesterase PaaI-like protein
MNPTLLTASLLALCCGCSGTAPHAESAGAASGAATAGPAAGAAAIPVRPLDPAPPALAEAEAKELGGQCALIEPEMYDAHKVALGAIDQALRTGTPAAKAESDALAKGIEALAKSGGMLTGAERKRCADLFAKREAGVLFEFEPAEEEARAVVDTCVKRVEAVFGKEKLSFDVGGGDRGPSQGPFCPDDLPVPGSLADLPYQSNKDDWDTPAWRCLQFGLRLKQQVQVEYIAPRGEGVFTCVARLLPRHGGAPVELYRGGKVSDEGVLLLAPKTEKRRLGAPR